MLNEIFLVILKHRVAEHFDPFKRLNDMNHIMFGCFLSTLELLQFYGLLHYAIFLLTSSFIELTFLPTTVVDLSPLGFSVKCQRMKN